MRIEQLAFLIEIAKYKSMSKASEHLHLTAQSLSRSINSMENELGFKLLERSSQGVDFTADGQKILAMAREIVACYEETLQSIDHTPQLAGRSLKGRLKVYAHPIFTASIFPRIIGEFCREYPNIKVSLIEDTSAAIVEQLAVAEEGVQKIGIVTLPKESRQMMARYTNGPWRFVPLGVGEYVACVSKCSPLAKEKRVSLKVLSEYPMVRFTDSDGVISEVQSFYLAPFQGDKVSFSTTSLRLWLQAITDDVGVGLIFDLVLAKDSQLSHDFQKVAVVPLIERTALLAGALVPDTPSEAADIFAAFVAKAFEKL